MERFNSIEFLAGCVLSIVIGCTAYSLGERKGKKFFIAIYIISVLMIQLMSDTLEMAGIFFLFLPLAILGEAAERLISVSVGCLIGTAVANIICVIKWRAKRRKKKRHN